MYIKLLLASALCLFACKGYSQLKGFSLGPYAEMGWPTGDFQHTNKNGLGAGLGADIRLGKLGLTGSAGFIHFPGKTVADENGENKQQALNAVPIRVGIKFRPVPLLYLKLETGAARLTKNNTSAFILSPGIGLRFLGLDIMAKYETWSATDKYSFWGLKAGLNF